MSDSLWPYGPQHDRTLCPSPTPRVHSNSSPLSQWCHPTILSSVVPFSSCLQSFPASGSFQMSQLFTSGGQSIGGSASTSVLPMNSQDWFPLGLTDWISLLSKGLSRVFSDGAVQKYQFFDTQLSLWSNSHIHTQSLPSGSFHKLLILIHQRADRMKTTITGNWPNWSHEPQPCLTLWNYEPCHVGPPKTDGSWWRGLTKCGPLEKGMANHFSILALRTPWTVWKGKKIWHWKIYVYVCVCVYMLPRWY